MVRPEVDEEVPLADVEATVLYEADDLREAIARHSGEPPPSRKDRPVAGDVEATVVFSDHDEEAGEEWDTSPRKRLDEALLDDDEDSIARSRAVPDLGGGAPEAALPPLDEDDQAGQYHEALDLSDIDTAPRESLEEDTQPTAPLPRPLSPAERSASGLLVALGALVLLWFVVNLLM